MLKPKGAIGTRSLSHQFTPAPASSTPKNISLSIRAIEDAALKEILQTPGPGLGLWGLFDQLLDQNSNEFRFIEPLGQSREVRTALSALFGRFVARAYAKAYLKLTHYAHIQSPPMQLSRPMRGLLQRVPGPNGLGDMPDWVAWGARKGMAIVEAKGSHNPNGPGAILTKAFTQANRAEICDHRGHRAPFKRYAIATRWGFSAPKDWKPMLWVQDPDEQGDNLLPEEIQELNLGIIRLHNANLLDRLGHRDLAISIREIVTGDPQLKPDDLVKRAMQALDSATLHGVVTSFRPEPDDELVGGFVTRSGVLPSTILSARDMQTLSRLQMRPAFVGIERQMLMFSIVGDLKAIKKHSSRALQSRKPTGPQNDGDGSWVIRSDEDEARISPTRLRI